MSNSMNFRYELIAVGIGGIFGAIGRYSVSFLFLELNGFPYATFTVNMMGCFLLSFLLNNKQFKTKVNPKIFLGLSTGLIGSFTTFSTFSIETIELLGASFFLATFYVFLSVVGGLIFCYIGFYLASRRGDSI